MDTEYEATFRNIDKNTLRKTLQKAGATLSREEFIQKRVVMSLPAGHEIKGGWLRIRDEGNKTTLTLKVVDGVNIENQKEISFKIDDFEKAEQLLTSLGCAKTAYQESKRELWLLDGVEITIDEWPFLNPYTEIEGKSGQAVRDVAEKLGFDFSEALFCSIDKLYSLQYGFPVDVINNHTPVLKFEGENPFQSYIS